MSDVSVFYKSEVLAESTYIEVAQSKSCISRNLTSCQLTKQSLDKLDERDSGQFTIVNFAFILLPFPTRVGVSYFFECRGE